MAADDRPVATVEQLRALAHPIRWRIVRLCREQPRTNQELAERLEVSAPTMLRHVRILAERGFLAADPIRRGRTGATERPYRATGLTLRLAINDAPPSTARRDVDLAVLAAHRAELVEAGPGATVDSARGVLRLDTAAQRELADRIGSVLEEFRQRADPDGEELSFLWSMARRSSEVTTTSGDGTMHADATSERGTFGGDEAARVVVITGATGGIGEALVRAFAGRGDEVLAVARASERLEALCEQLPAINAVPLDLRKADEAAAELSGLDRVDLLIHCAGVAEVAAVEETSFDSWQTTMTINVTAAAELTRLMLPALRASGGQVVFINAAPGMRAVPRWSAYVASKAALRELADSLREEEADNGVRVSTIYPGGVATELLRKVRSQFGRPYEPENTLDPTELAALVATIVDLDANVNVTELSVRHASRASQPRPS